MTMNKALHPRNDVNSMCPEEDPLVISFLVLWSICWSSPVVHSKNDPEYLTRGIALVFVPLIRFQLYSLVSLNFLFIIIIIIIIIYY